MERLYNAKKTIGIKQTLKAVEKGIAEIVYIAQDAETKVIEPVLDICKQKKVPVKQVETMIELGKACKIDVGAAAAAVIKG